MQRQDKLREIIRDWLQMIMERHNVSQRQLGLRAGVSPSTINRAFDTDGNFVMSTSILTKIGGAFGEPPPNVLGDAPARPAGFSESDLVSFVGQMAGGKGENNIGRWQITSNALNLAGFLPGDVVEFDLGRHAEAGDVVVAQVVNLQRGSAETVLRLYKPPYLLTRSSDDRVDDRPFYVDGERVSIVGTFKRLLRERAA